MKIKIIKLFLVVAVGLFLMSGVLVCSESVFAESASYENHENIPGQKKADNLITYVENIYKFGIAIVAVLALFMIVLGSFNYIVTSVGNASKMLDAKDMIVKAVEGLVLALGAYLILFIINPDLIGSTMSGAKSVESKEDVYKGTECKGSSKYPSYHKACPKEKCQDKLEVVEKINFAEADKKKFDNECNNDKALIELFHKYGNGKKGECLLKVIADVESNCGGKNEKSSAGACGIMQMLPETARGLDSDLKSKSEEEICQELTENNDLAVRLAALYISRNSQNKISKTLASYNGGNGTFPKDGKKPPLASSSDCKSALAFECCVNPGGLDQTIGYAWDGVGLYKNCKEDYKDEEL